MLDSYFPTTEMQDLEDRWNAIPHMSHFIDVDSLDNIVWESNSNNLKTPNIKTNSQHGNKHIQFLDREAGAITGEWMIGDLFKRIVKDEFCAQDLSILI